MYTRLNKDVLNSLFEEKSRAFGDAIQIAIEGYERDFNEFHAGHRFNLAAFSDAVVAVGNARNVEGSSRVSIGFYDRKVPDLSKEVFLGPPTLRLDIPTMFLRSKAKPVFWLYNIRFQMMVDDAEVDARGMRPFRVGYFGITKRGVFKRFKEHRAKVESGNGHVLHKAWRGLITSNLAFHPVIQVSAMSSSLDEIYAYEEDAVAERSLTPMGLNTIPGGYAGIKMLHQLALLSDRKRVMPDDRDAALDALERSPGSKCTHYRSGHIRTLSSGKTTWVSPCWINLSEGAAQ